MATYACTACGNLHGAPVATCGLCGGPVVLQQPPPADVGGSGAHIGRDLAREMFERTEERQRRQDAVEAQAAEAEERRRNRLTDAGVALLGALVKLVDRTPVMPGSPPLVAPAPKG